MRRAGRGYGIQNTGCRDLNPFLVVLVVSLFCAAGSVDTTEFQKTLPAKVVWGAIGRDVELPCDVTPPVPSDAVNMVFWFKDSIGMPLYSLDARGGPLTKASHLALTDDLGTRSYFITEEEPSRARLKIQNVSKQDEGVFRCRVDFVNSPTRNFKVNLTLVVQPSAPKIFNAEGREVINNAGPFLEGEELFLSCQVKGGVPKPSIVWLNNNTVIDAVVDSPKDKLVTVNQLLIPALPRSYFGATLECRVTSMEVAGSVSKEVAITVYLKPNKVKIVTPNDLLSVSRPQLHRCETSGSYPPARITWLLDGKAITNAVTTEEEEKSFSSSIISLNVEVGDDGKDLVCRADNPRFPGGHAEDRRQIRVAYPPKVTVKADPPLESPVKEGSGVILRCDYTARPSPHSFRWYHNGHLIPYNDSAGVLPVDHVLTLRGVSRASEGDYSCAATNSEGETYSAPFRLTIQYPPRCKKGHEVMRVSALPAETLVVQCHVDAIPDVTRFHWTYNTSKGVNPVKGAKMQNKGNVSVLHFSPGINDLESLSCWATNDVGRQESPCLFYIVPAAKPESPKNCQLQNATGGGLEVRCMAGNDGGLEQSFVLEVKEVSVPDDPATVTTLSDQGGHAEPVYRVLGETPQFRLHNLEPDREYELSVYAVNAKGRSDPPVVMSNIKVDIPTDALEERESNKVAVNPGGGPQETRPNLTLILVGLAAAVVLLIVCIVTVAAVLACRRQPTVVLRRERRNRNKSSEDVELSDAGFGDEFRRRSAQYRASLYAQEVEERASIRNYSGPDLILAPVSFAPQSSDY